MLGILFFRSEFDTHTRGAVPGGAGAALPAWQGGRARAGPAEPREPLPCLGCDPRDRFHSIIGQIFPYQISAQVSTSLARIMRNIQGKPGAFFSHLLFARNLVFWDSGRSAGTGSSRMTIHGQSSGICLNSKQVWRKNRKPGSLRRRLLAVTSSAASFGLFLLRCFFSFLPLTLFKSCSLISLQVKAIKELSEQHPFQRCLQGMSSPDKPCLEARRASGEHRESIGSPMEARLM